MGKIYTEKITRFDGGIIDDIRERTDRGFQISNNFDIFTNPLRLTPHRATTANETKAQNIIRFLYTNGKLYGYGVASGNSRPAIYYKASNAISDAWTAPTDNEASSGTTRWRHVFFHYKNYLYGWVDNATLWRWGDLTGVPTFDESWKTVSNFTYTAEPLIHPTDDIAYFFTDNFVHTNNAGTWSANALTLPSNMIITDAEPVGNLLAIACRPKDAGGKSVVFLWDRDSSLSTITGKIDWGEGNLLYIAYLDGNLIGVTDYFLNDSTLNLSAGKLIIKVASGEKARTIKEIQKTADDTTSFIPNTGISSDGTNVDSNSVRTKIIRDNKLYIPGAMSDQAETWRGAIVITGDGRVTMDTVESEATSLEGMFVLGRYWFFAHSLDGSVNRTDTTYGTAVYQSQKFTEGDAGTTKKLLGVTVTFAPLPSGASVIVKYRKDEATTWTTIFTHTTANSIRHTARNIESSDANLPTYKEIQFRIESTGGAEITGLKFKAEEVEDDIY